MTVLDMRYDELVSSIGGLSCDQVWAGSGHPAIDREDYMGVYPYNVVTFYYKAIVNVYFKVADDCTGMGKVSTAMLTVPRGSEVFLSGDTVTIVGEGNNRATVIEKTGYTTEFIVWNNDKVDETKTYTVKTIDKDGYVFYAHFEQEASTFPVNSRVVSDSTGPGSVSTATGEKADCLEVPYGNTVPINGGKETLSGGSISTPKAVSVTAGLMAPHSAGEMPLRNWGLGLTLGYDAPVDDADHAQYWTASFDFSENYGKWPYGDKAVMAVRFFFSDGGGIADTYGVYGLGSLYASDYVLVPVMEVYGTPYVEPVVCTSDLWPVAGDGRILAYPVMAEAVLYTSLYNEDGEDDKV